MKFRAFANSSCEVSEVGIGTWQLGGAEWGEVPESQALATLEAAADAGTTFIDTADIYGHGRSESLIGQFLKNRPDRDRFFIATKLGRSPDPGWPANFEPATVRLHTERSLQRLGVDALDLTQTHCIPSEIMQRDSYWDALRDLKAAGKIKAFGASVESVEEALACLQIEGLSSLQIIFNVFRQKPIEQLFPKLKGVAIIVRLPLASGLLSGKFSLHSQFGPRDHRNFNRDGQSFNVGETFAGLPFDKGLELVELLRQWIPSPGETGTAGDMATWALRWCLDFPEVTTVIPGASRPAQSLANARASDLPNLAPATHQGLRDFYRQQVAPHIRGKY